MEEKKVEEIKEEVKEVKKENKVLKIILAIILIGLFFGLGWFAGVKLASFEEKVTSDNSENKEETPVDEDSKNEENKDAIDKDVAPSPAVVKIEKFKAETTTTKPDYGIDDGDYEFYKDGYLGYSSDRYYFGEEDVQPDREEYEFIKLYECKNKEYGKCGVAEPLGVSGEYNLEEGLKLAAEGLIYLDRRYIFIYDSNLYQKYDYASYFSKEAPLIVYDTKLKKEVVQLAGIYAEGYSASSSSLVGINFEGKYGAFKIEDGNYVELIPFEYEYIGKLYEENQFMLVKDKQYYVYNPINKKTYGPYNNQISQYSEKFIVTNEGSYLNGDDNNPERNYRLYTIDGKVILNNSGNNYIDLIGDYALVIDKDGILQIYDVTGKGILKEPIPEVNHGAYHIRCCAAFMAYSAEINGKILTLGVNKQTEEDYWTVEYTIDLTTGTYTSKKI